MGGRAEGLACADPGARTPICASGIYIVIIVILLMSTAVVAPAIIWKLGCFIEYGKE